MVVYRPEIIHRNTTEVEFACDQLVNSLIRRPTKTDSQRIFPNSKNHLQSGWGCLVFPLRPSATIPYISVLTLNDKSQRTRHVSVMIEEIICRKEQRPYYGFSVLDVLSSFVLGMLIRSKAPLDSAQFAYFQRQLSVVWCIAPFLMCLLCALC